MTIRAKFRCQTVTQTHSEPYEVRRHQHGETEQTPLMTWPRTYDFMAVYDDGTPENQRYAQATPFGQLKLQVDNPAVVFEPGKNYYLDVTPAD